jgi:hypothetical protein
LTFGANGYSQATTLTNDLTTAVALYTKKRDHFRGLSRMYPEKVQQWKLCDRQPNKVGKEVKSIYKHNKSKGEPAFTLAICNISVY